MDKLFDDSDLQENKVDHQAREVATFGNSLVTVLVEFYRRGRRGVWYLPGWSRDDCQALLDKLGPRALLMFSGSAQLGKLINDQAPGFLAPEELQAPMPYTIEGNRIVLDRNATYPGPEADPAPVR